MSGGITQLVAVGAQDTHLVGSPEVSFFQSSYKRHTNFSSVIERQVIQNTPAANGLSSIRFERKGDMLSYIYLTNVNSSDAVVVEDWSTVINKVELYIGGQLIDTQHYEYSTNVHTEVMANSFSKSVYGSGPSAAEESVFFYPFKFWFCENWQSSLPLIALQYHDVEVRIYWAGTLANTYEAWARYIYLDADERRMMAEKPMDMLIHQVQRIPAPGSKTLDLTFNHPVKFIASNAAVFSTASNRVLLQLNGVDVGEKKHAFPHFKQVASYYHTSYGSSSSAAQDGFESMTLVMPFCLDASKLQPTGTCNFSRMDSARLVSDAAINGAVYAVNYNILRIQNGMGGLLYAN
jgi:hypothetical protein